MPPGIFLDHSEQLQVLTVNDSVRMLTHNDLVSLSGLGTIDRSGEFSCAKASVSVKTKVLLSLFIIAYYEIFSCQR